MIDKIQAVGHHVLIVREEAETERNGLLIPEHSLKKPGRGKVLSIGSEVKDKSIEVGKIAIFHKASGNPIEIDGQEVSFLIQNDNQQQVLAVIDENT